MFDIFYLAWQRPADTLTSIVQKNPSLNDIT